MDWDSLLSEERKKDYFAELTQFVAHERSHHAVYPPADEVFTALHVTSCSDTKVLILGQDPYHGAGQAHGLCFSVRHGTAIPPSLRNIFTELESDLGIPRPPHGDLTEWARRGVLLLNATLTVRAGHAGSHQGRGWETFTDEIIRIVNGKHETVVFVLWGSYARKKRALIDESRHVVVESPHPSPLSARNGFFGSTPFTRVNEALRAAGRGEIDWSL